MGMQAVGKPIAWLVGPRSEKVLGINSAELLDSAVPETHCLWTSLFCKHSFSLLNCFGRLNLRFLLLATHTE